MTQANDPNSGADSAAVLRCWQDNAAAWTAAVREAKIRSRTLVTNRAILDAILARAPSRVLDLGCGEGWLSWSLAAENIPVLGVDAIAALIEAAKSSPSDAESAPLFRTLDYAQVPLALAGERFDLIVCNFSLLDQAGVANLMLAIPALLAPNGTLLIQTLHPDFVGTPANRSDGWRSETWQGIGEDFRGQAPWYYRTLASWRRLFVQSDLQLTEQLEPPHPETGLPASVIFVLGV